MQIAKRWVGLACLGLGEVEKGWVNLVWFELRSVEACSVVSMYVISLFGAFGPQPAPECKVEEPAWEAIATHVACVRACSESVCGV